MAAEDDRVSFFRRPRSCCAVSALRVRTLPRIHGWRCQHSRSTFFHQHCRSHLIANRFQVSTVRSVFRIRCMVCPRPTVTRMLNPSLSPTFRTSFFIYFIYSFDAAHTHSALPGQKRLIWLEGSAACDEIDFDNIQPHNAGGLRQALQRVVDLGSEAVLPVSSLTRANTALRILDAYVRQSPRALYLCRTVHPTLFVNTFTHTHCSTSHASQIHRRRVHSQRRTGLRGAILRSRGIRGGPNLPSNHHIAGADTVQTLTRSFRNCYYI